MYGQTQIPTGLQTAIQAQMEREVMSGQAKTMTSDETPTVFGQLMQQVAPRPAGVGQAMEQAGLAGQIQAMKMQQAQQALMQQAMAQQPQMMARGGLANLNVDIDGFADGGIVGYADGAYVKNPLALLLEKIKEAGLPTRGGASTERAAQADRVDPEMAREILAATTPMQEIPEITIQESTPPSSPREQSEPRATGIAATSPAAAFYDQARGALEKLKSSPVSQQAGVTAGLEAMAADDEMRRKLGLPTLAEQYARMSEEDKALVAERQALIAGRLREAQEKRSSGQLGAFLRSARGRSLGETLGAAERGREAFESGLTGQIRGFEDLQLEIKGLQIQRQNALNKARDDIAMGKKKEAMESLQNAQNKANEIALKEADLYRFQAGTTSEEFRTRMTVEEANRRNALLAQQGQDQKIQGALTANLRNKETIEKNIYDDFEKDQRVKAYRAIQMTGKIPPDIQSGYDKAVSERNSLINARTRNINATINRLETQLYGAPVGAAATNAITMDDVRTTAAKSGKTVQQVIEQAKAKGYSITGQ